MTKEEETFFSVADVLRTRLEGLEVGRLHDTLKLKKEWPEIVGAMTAQHSQVLYIKNNCLHVGVKNSTWLNELNLIKEEILKKIFKIKIDGTIQNVKFKLYFDSK